MEAAIPPKKMTTYLYASPEILVGTLRIFIKYGAIKIATIDRKNPPTKANIIAV